MSMLGPFRYMVYITLLFSIVMAVYPLLRIYLDLSSPQCLTFQLVSAEPLNDTHMRLVVKVSYCSPITLKDVKLTVSGQKIELGDLAKGEKEFELIVPATSQGMDIEEMEFNVFGLYPVKISGVAKWAAPRQ